MPARHNRVDSRIPPANRGPSSPGLGGFPAGHGNQYSWEPLGRRPSRIFENAPIAAAISGASRDFARIIVQIKLLDIRALALHARPERNVRLFRMLESLDETRGRAGERIDDVPIAFGDAFATERSHGKDFALFSFGKLQGIFEAPSKACRDCRKPAKRHPIKPGTRRARAIAISAGMRTAPRASRPKDVAMSQAPRERPAPNGRFQDCGRPRARAALNGASLDPLWRKRIMRLVAGVARLARLRTWRQRSKPPRRSRRPSRHREPAKSGSTPSRCRRGS